MAEAARAAAVTEVAATKVETIMKANNAAMKNGAPMKVMQAQTTQVKTNTGKQCEEWTFVDTKNVKAVLIQNWLDKKKVKCVAWKMDCIS